MNALCSLVLADLPAFFKAELKLRQRICKLQESPPSTDDPRCHLREESVRRHHEDGIERIKGIEAKAERLLVSLSITVSVVFAGASLLADTLLGLPMPLRVLVPILLVLSVLYFLLAALCALKATRVAERYLVTIEEEAEGLDVADIVQMIDLNNQTATRKANLESVATDALRNGLVLLVILIVAIAAGLTLVSNDSPSPDDAQPPGIENESTAYADHGPKAGSRASRSEPEGTRSMTRTSPGQHPAFVAALSCREPDG